MARGGGRRGANSSRAPGVSPIGNQFSVFEEGETSSVEMSRSSADDSSNPFFLSNSDHPGLSLVTHCLIGENYNTWRRAMLMALMAKNKLGFVDGTIVKPDSIDLNYNAWLRCNSMVVSWLLNAVAKEIGDSLIYMDVASDMWLDLYDRFHQSNAPRIFQIRQNLSSLVQGTQDVTNYYTKVKVLWDELKEYRPIAVCNCGGVKCLLDFQEQEHVIQFLMGLNDSYAQVRAQILMMEPLPLIKKVFSLVVQEERQRSLGNSVSFKTEVAGFNVTGSSGNSDSRGEALINASSGQNSRWKQRDRPVCSHCGFTGHVVDRCYKLHGYPPGFKQKQVLDRAVINQAGSTSDTVGGSPSSLEGFTPNQCQQMIALLSAQLQSSQSSLLSRNEPPVLVSNFTAGSHSEDSDWEG